MSKLREDLLAIAWAKSNELEAGLFKGFSKEETEKRGAELSRLTQEIWFLGLIDDWRHDAFVKWHEEQNR